MADGIKTRSGEYGKTDVNGEVEIVRKGKANSSSYNKTNIPSLLVIIASLGTNFMLASLMTPPLEKEYDLVEKFVPGVIYINNDSYNATKDGWSYEQ